MWSRSTMLALVIPVAIGLDTQIDYLKLDPCKLLCHLEHSRDQCKRVGSTPGLCTGFFWESDRKESTRIGRFPDADYEPVRLEEAIQILGAPVGGCDKICDSHHDCIDIGSECKESGVCLNLFWKRAPPIPGHMTTCYALSDEECDDGTPILCGDEGLTGNNSFRSNNSTSDSPDSQTPSKTTNRSPANTQNLGNVKSSTDSRPTLVSPLLVVPFFMYHYV